MRPLEDIEAALSRLVERPFAQRARGRPTLDVRNLLHQVTRHPRAEALLVAVNPTDLELLADLIPQIEAELAQSLEATGHGNAVVRFVADVGVSPGSFELRRWRPDITQAQPSLARPSRQEARYVLGVEGRGLVPVHCSPFRLGRAPDNDLVLDDSTVSRYHAVLELEADALAVTDLKSTNGTYLNGRRIYRSRLKGGDILHLGQLEIRVEKD